MWELVVGLEVHVQLLTESKLFCSCKNKFTHEPNTHVCPVCLGQPGVLPVLNRKAFEMSLKAALALDCQIASFTKFDRKHYYYPDLPKNFQISQYDMPYSEHGHLDVTVDGTTSRIGITRIHLEEDAGKLIHGGGSSAVDLNRTGTPLMEVVSEPDIRSAAEAKAYLQKLHQILRYIEVSDCNMQEGSLRCDANLSIRRPGETTLGTKNEIKNMNSFKGVEHAIELVMRELIDSMEQNRPIQQVTWGYNLDRGTIQKMRVKENANDYRYFPEPDLPPVHVSQEWIDEIRATLCELPAARCQRFMTEFELSAYDAEVLTQERGIAEYFEAVAKASGMPKESANWVINDVIRELNDRHMEIGAFSVSADALGEILALVSDKTINMPTARKLFTRLIDEPSDLSPKMIVEKEGLGQVSDTGPIEAALADIITANPKAVADIESGKHQTAGFFIGQVMRAMKGQAAPDVVTGVVAARFGIDPALLLKKK